MSLILKWTPKKETLEMKKIKWETNANSSKNTRRSKLLDLCKKSAVISAKSLLTFGCFNDLSPDMATKGERFGLSF